ncbi:MAG: amidase [Phenylobacterium sp.]|uniref:amidase n=1 Tax=Phenylobacterium sp. TaxID=1871053 RepID=UPI0027362252|nr:amidase [Phenylobacterium sp.]MDP3749986.1 amidase [Phenylobacterium sp.]
MEYQTATRLVADLRSRRVSATELLDHAVGRIEALDGAINAVVVRDFDRARSEARKADMALAAGDTRPLLGLPMTVKEAFNVAGLPTTWGLPGARDIPVLEDAVVVARLKAAGAIVIGKTNVPTMLADWQSANPVHGVTRNPWDLSRTPGGSSGGGAAALAAGFVSLEFGSDLASSLRAPAHFCGVYAHKPSHGLIPSRGFVPPGVPATCPAPAIDLAVVGPMARCADDLALALEVTAGPDAHEAVGYRLQLPPPRHDALKDHRVLVLDQHPLLPNADSIRAALAERAARLEALGCRVGRESPHLPDLAQAAATFIELLMAQMSADSPDSAFAQARMAAEGLPVGVDPMTSAAVRGGALSHRDWIIADRLRMAFAHQWRELFRDWDVVLCPAMPTAALPLNGSGGPAMIQIDGAAVQYEAQPLWGTLATLTGNPATAFPIGLDGQGLPIGAQAVGSFLEDRTTIAFAGLMAREFGGFTPPPTPWRG